MTDTPRGSAACDCACHRKGWFHAAEGGFEKPCCCFKEAEGRFGPVPTTPNLRGRGA